MSHWYLKILVVRLAKKGGIYINNNNNMALIIIAHKSNKST